MTGVDYKESSDQKWETVTDGVTRTILRSRPGENRVLIRIESGKAYPHHSHDVPNEVFVVDGSYVDPNVENGKEFGAGTYLYYPPGTEHNATSLTGCVILVWNSKAPK